MAQNSSDPGSPGFDPGNTGINPYGGGTSQYTQPVNPNGQEGSNNQGTNRLSGFASNYSPTGLENIWQNPWMILAPGANGAGVFGPNINLSGAGYQGLRNLQADPMSLYEMMAGRGNALTGLAGQNGQTDGTGTGNYVNWLASLYNNLGSVGGRGFSAGELLSNLFNPQGNAAAGGSSLENLLATGDASTQMRTLFNMAKDATNVGMSPLAARGYQGALSRAGDQALAQYATTNVGGGNNATNVPMYQLLKQIAPGLAPG